MNSLEDTRYLQKHLLDFIPASIDAASQTKITAVCERTNTPIVLNNIQNNARQMVLACTLNFPLYCRINVDDKYEELKKLVTEKFNNTVYVEQSRILDDTNNIIYTRSFKFSYKQCSPIKIEYGADSYNLFIVDAIAGVYLHIRSNHTTRETSFTFISQEEFKKKQKEY